MKKTFWTDSRNKYNIFTIFHFLGLEMTNYYILNRCIYDLFKRELKILKDLDKYSKTLLKECANFDSLFQDDNLLCYILKQTFTEEKNIPYENRTIRSKCNDDVNLNKRLLKKLLFLKNIHQKFREAFKDELVINQKTFINLINFLNLYLEMYHYFDRNIVLNKFDFSHPTITDEQFELIKTYCRKIDCKILSFKINYNEITDTNCAFIAELIKNNLNELDISYNRLTAKGKNTIFSAVKESTSLTNLYFLKPEKDDFPLLKESLKVNNSISYLNLSYCKFNEESMKILLDGLKSNNNLTHLILKGIDIRKAMWEISLFLKSNVSLKELNISAPSEMNAKISYLFKVLSRFNHTLEILDISHITFSNKMYFRFHIFLKNNRGVHTLSLGENTEMNVDTFLKRLAKFYLREDLYIHDLNTKICRVFKFLGGSTQEINCKSVEYLMNNCNNHKEEEYHVKESDVNMAIDDDLIAFRNYYLNLHNNDSGDDSENKDLDISADEFSEFDS